LVAAQTIRRLDPDFPDDSPVAVALVPCDPHLRAKDQTGKVFLGALAEGLRILRCVDSGDADLVLLAVGIEHGYLVSAFFSFVLSVTTWA
jgi:hypothetical protein